MSRTLNLMIAAVLALAPMAGRAATFSASVGPPANGGIGNCVIPGLVSGSDPVSTSGICADSRGLSDGRASSNFGHIGGRSEGVTLGNSGIVAAFGTTSIFTDQLMFTSSDPDATVADVAVNLILEGVLNAAADAANGGDAGSEVGGFVQIGGDAFLLQYAVHSDGVFFVIHQQLGLTGGIAGPKFNGSFVSPTVHVALGSPTSFTLFLETNAAAVGSHGSALSDFSNSFKLPTGSDAFNLPAGVTVNAGDWLVNNRFIDPLALGGVPEPASWALMIAGFGLSGALVRRRRALTA